MFGGLMTYSGLWPRSGMMRDGEACEHQKWAPHTGANGGSVSHGWPTASASDWKGSTKPGQRRRQLTEKIEPHNPGRLNPEWVEMLMGFPAGWTATDGPPHPDHTSTHTSHPAPTPDSPPTSND